MWRALGRTDTNLSLVGYSTPKTVMGKIISAWQQTPGGKGVSFTTSYGPSGDQARAVAAGLKADLVFLSTGDDVNTLVDAGLVSPNWQKQSYGGNQAYSVVAFAFRGSNPKHIKTWDDLVKPGVQIVTPNPFSSGSAKWNVLAAYAAARREGKTDKQAQSFVRSCSRTSSRRTARAGTRRTRSSRGKGDVLLTYESEAVAAQQAGQNIGYLVPGRDDADRAADRADQDELEPRAREQVHRLHEDGAGAGSARPERLPPGAEVGREEVPVEVSRHAV